MGSFDDNFMDEFFDYNFMSYVTSPEFPLLESSIGNIDFSQTRSVLHEQEPPKQCPIQSCSLDIDFSQAGSASSEHEFEREYPNKRGRAHICSKPKTKACRERERREKVNKSFLGLSSVLEPERVSKTDKLAILDDAIRVVSHLRAEAESYKDENKRLQKEIQCLKAEKNELREEKLTLKAEKENMERQLKVISAPSPGLVSSYPSAYPAAADKLDHFPSYGMYPMWHYLPSSTRDTTRDIVLRPPAA